MLERPEPASISTLKLKGRGWEGKRAHVVSECPPCKPEDLSLNPSTCIKKPGMVVWVDDPSVLGRRQGWGTETGESLELTKPA